MNIMLPYIHLTSCVLCVLQECPVGLLALWRTACFRGQTSRPAALWSISVTQAFTCWETPKCTAATMESGEAMHQPVSVFHQITLFLSSHITFGKYLIFRRDQVSVLLCVCVIRRG